MNSGPPPAQPEDDASDPLLRALRQRLGDYGQAPPPSAWAAIRQQLVRPAVRPWWQRPRRLLPLLGLLLGLLLVGTLATQEYSLLATRTRRPQKHVAPLAQDPTTAPTSSANRLGRNPTKRAALPGAGSYAPGIPTSGLATKPALATGGGSSKLRQLAAGSLSHLSAEPSTNAQLTTSSAVATAATQQRAPRSYRAKFGTSQPSPASATGSGYPAGRQHLAAQRASHASRTKHWPANSLAGAPAYLTGQAAAALVAKRGQVPPHASLLTKHTMAQLRQSYARQVSARVQVAPTSHRAPTRRATGAASTASHQRERVALAQADGAGGLLTSPPDTRTHLDLLAQRLAQLALPAALPLPAAMARPDSTLPAAPMRHWSLLVLGGPTLSYRTLGPVPPTTPSPDFARLERPAVGLGAQVQLRRVLSGRWAVAVGLGYHEYATRLNLQLADSAARQLQLRDTYRLLTLPLQATYALGAPHGRLARALLVGTEVGWYRGGRSTEGSTCSCQQQEYNSAAGSPYRPWSLAFTLGLDLRYQLGSAAGRWHWVVQPTGRYVLSPFVRSEALGYTHRQPFSLGLLTGFSWDIR